MVHNILFKVQRSEYFLGEGGEKFINRGVDEGWVGAFFTFVHDYYRKKCFLLKNKPKKNWNVLTYFSFL
jgi:hypothetical protein